MRPATHVLEAFGADGPALKLPGGRGTAWRVGNVVLKPLDVLPSELEWLHRITWCNASPDDIRLSLPIMSRTGELVIDGWTAFPVLDGEHKTERWAEIATVARVFADRFRGVDRPLSSTIVRTGGLAPIVSHGVRLNRPISTALLGFAQYLVRALVFRIATDWFNQLARPALYVYQDISVRVLDLVSDDDEV